MDFKNSFLDLMENCFRRVDKSILLEISLLLSNKRRLYSIADNIKKQRMVIYKIADKVIIVDGE